MWKMADRDISNIKATLYNLALEQGFKERPASIPYYNRAKYDKMKAERLST